MRLRCALCRLIADIDATSQYVELTIKRTGGYVAPDTQECEGFLFGAITAGVVKGYEFDIYFAGTLLQPVRWDDSSIGDYDFSAVTAVAGEDPNAWPGNLVDGDVVKIVGKIVGGDPKFWVYVNSGLVRVLHDTTAGKITSGQPGFAFFVRTGSGVDLTGFALKRVKVGTAA
jgi:hypothetical protein